MISIVTPSFRQPDWLRLAMSSVADQQGVDVEHIIQDGGTEEIQAAFDKVTRSIKSDRYHPQLFVEKDEGMYDAINRGLRKSQGQICGYLNCDEQYLPGTLATALNFFDAHPGVDVLFGDLILVNAAGQPLSYRRTILPDEQHLRLAHLNTTTCATFFRRTLLERGFFFPQEWKTIGDAAWVDQLLKNGVRMATLPEPLAVFTLTGENLGASATSDSEIQRFQGEQSGGMKFKRAWVILLHRIRKALAGAYKHRQVEIDIFTLNSPDKREHASAKNVGFGWPSQKTS